MEATAGLEVPAVGWNQMFMSAPGRGLIPLLGKAPALVCLECVAKF